jgi:hypothetical protein
MVSFPQSMFEVAAKAEHVCERVGVGDRYQAEVTATWPPGTIRLLRHVERRRQILSFSSCRKSANSFASKMAEARGDGRQDLGLTDRIRELLQEHCQPLLWRQGGGLAVRNGYPV